MNHYKKLDEWSRGGGRYKGWNCRNLTDQGNLPLFYNFFEQHKPEIVMLNETRGFNAMVRGNAQKIDVYLAEGP